jgi:hypothetical protein
MFLHLAKCLQWLATALAFLAPFAILHWILMALNLPETLALVNFGNTVFIPLNEFAKAVLPFEAPSILYEERNVSTLQAFSAMLLIVVFFVLIAIAEGCKKLNAAWVLADSQQRQDMQLKTHKANKEKERQANASFKEIILLIQFPFFDHPQLGSAFKQFVGYGGRELPSDPNTLAIGFNDVDKALIYAKQIRTLMLDHYQNLPPAEAKPQFNMTLHAHKPTEELAQALAVCLQLGRYATTFGIIVSQALYNLLVARDMVAGYPSRSLGFYLFPSGENEEVFQLNLNDSALTAQLY